MPVQTRPISLSELQVRGVPACAALHTPPNRLHLSTADRRGLALYEQSHACPALCLCPQVREPKVQEVNSIEASMRLDAVASAGFRISRGKMADLIKGGEWQVGGGNV